MGREQRRDLFQVAIPGSVMNLAILAATSNTD
jgi:hypothetical protein